MQNKITDFKIESYGCVELTTNKNGATVKHSYYSVPREVIKKFINASTEPSVKDFEDWLKDAKDKDADNKIEACSSSCFWSN